MTSSDKTKAGDGMSPPDKTEAGKKAPVHDHNRPGFLEFELGVGAFHWLGSLGVIVVYMQWMLMLQFWVVLLWGLQMFSFNLLTRPGFFLKPSTGYFFPIERTALDIEHIRNSLSLDRNLAEVGCDILRRTTGYEDCMFVSDELAGQMSKGMFAINMLFILTVLGVLVVSRLKEFYQCYCWNAKVDKSTTLLKNAGYKMLWRAMPYALLWNLPDAFFRLSSYTPSFSVIHYMGYPTTLLGVVILSLAYTLFSASMVYYKSNQPVFGYIFATGTVFSVHLMIFCVVFHIRYVFGGVDLNELPRVYVGIVSVVNSLTVWVLIVVSISTYFVVLATNEVWHSSNSVCRGMLMEKPDRHEKCSFEQFIPPSPQKDAKREEVPTAKDL